MLKLLIVDDEPIILEGLVKTIPWEKWGFNVVGSAKDGVQALLLMEKFHPNVVITDILMNQMTGLQLIETTLKRFPDIVFVVMSAHKEFDYAKTACSLGAYSYLLKPLNEQELQDTMNSVYDYHMQKSEDQSLAKTYDAFFNKHADSYIHSLFNSYISNQITESVFLDSLAIAKKDWSSMNYLCVCATVDFSTNIHQLQSGRYAFLHYLKKHLAEYFDGYVFESSNLNLLLVLTLPTTGFFNRRRLDALFAGFKSAFQMDVIFSISNEYSAISDINKAVKESQTLLEMANDAGIDQLYPEALSKDFPLSTTEFRYPQYFANQLVESIRSLSELRAKKALENFIIELAPITNAEYQKLCIQRLSLEIWTSFIHLNLPDTLLSSLQNFTQNFDSIHILKTIPILNQNIIELIRYLEDLNELSVNQTAKSYISQAKAYAKDHITDEYLTVATMANILHLNPVYFGRIFKKETTDGFKTYLLRLRLEEAKLLLRNTNHSIVKISEQVGIPNPSYFSQLFKANVGCLPNEYRKGGDT